MLLEVKILEENQWKSWGVVKGSISKQENGRWLANSTIPEPKHKHLLLKEEFILLMDNVKDNHAWKFLMRKVEDGRWLRQNSHQSMTTQTSKFSHRPLQMISISSVDVNGKYGNIHWKTVGVMFFSVCQPYVSKLHASWKMISFSFWELVEKFRFTHYLAAN